MSQILVQSLDYPESARIFAPRVLYIPTGSSTTGGYRRGAWGVFITNQLYRLLQESACWGAKVQSNLQKTRSSMSAPSISASASTSSVMPANGTPSKLGFFFLVAQSKYSKYYAAQKNSSYFLEPTTRRGVPNAHVNSKPMVSRFCVVASQNTVEPNRAQVISS